MNCIIYSFYKCITYRMYCRFAGLKTFFVSQKYTARQNVTYTIYPKTISLVFWTCDNQIDYIWKYKTARAKNIHTLIRQLTVCFFISASRTNFSKRSLTRFSITDFFIRQCPLDSGFILSTKWGWICSDIRRFALANSLLGQCEVKKFR